jgi:hypothetical protein
MIKMMYGKKAIKWMDQWAEYFSFGIMLLGIILALISNSAVITYAIIMLCGFVVGRTYYIRKSRLGSPFYFITFFFLAGYCIGTLLTRRGSILIVVVCFIVGIYIGNAVYKRHLIR